MKLLARNLTVLPFVVAFRTLPGLIGYVAMYADKGIQAWLGVCDRIGIYWKREGE